MPELWSIYEVKLSYFFRTTVSDIDNEKCENDKKA